MCLHNELCIHFKQFLLHVWKTFQHISIHCRDIQLHVVFVNSNGCRRKPKSVSCPGLGSFSKSGPYRHWKLPKCPNDLNVKMRLYTRRNWNNAQMISATAIPSMFRRGQNTIFLVHGYKKADQWFGGTKGAFLRKGDFNVITVNWDSDGRYSRAAPNTRTVGAAVAQVARNLVAQNRISRQKLWCVGHSLGAHTCGLAGKRYRFARITGLDPAGPKYSGNEDAGLVARSADFVDVIHTGANLLGIMSPVGHVDFYPNGGKHQPGCHGSMYFKCNVSIL
ncbi:hypothetical protein NP493_303g00006 [Ridgeia piscesae]|uniref:Lipase domain-containing protein n=1 Tax=Ridgeia piscesae TaxID=27915 RepID=A0AAD9L5B3_RIDPI|nr:hypothetical protein NP493_303g00006 [Ridgeia piscesae]